ncbi:MAG TPA: hypothetical protein VE981_12820 [Planctomycetota bacterium]|nr:hypothetical protein [Planctomycetota bacterium]
MNEQDKAVARRALRDKRLSIDQVEQIKAEVERTGRPFREIAFGRGLLSAEDLKARPPKQMPTVYVALLAASLVIFMALLIATTAHLQERSRKDEELAVGSSRNMSETERKSAQARKGYDRSIIQARETRAKEALAKARAAMARADTALKTAPQSPEISLALDEAFTNYNVYLESLPDDADVRIERSRTHTLRRNYDLAIADLERAAQLKPAAAKACQDQISQLRLFVARDPK